MAGRPGRSGRRGQDHSSPLVDVDVVFADDRLIDRIAQRPWGPADRAPSTGGAHRRDAHRPAFSELATADPLTELFETWRDELAADPMPALPQLRPTLVPQVADRPAKRRSLRPALAVAAAIAALLVGSATIGSKNAAPDSALWTITQVMWPERVESVASRDTALGAIAEAQTAIKAGRSRDAQLALLKATVALGNVDDIDGLDDMKQQVNDLWVVASPTPKAASTLPDGSSASTSAGSSSDLPTPFGSTVPSTLASAPPAVVTSSDPASELAGGSVGAPAQAPASVAPPAAALVPALDPPVAQTPVVPSDSVPSSVVAAPSSPAPVSVSEVPPPSSDPPPADQTTSLPPPEPVQSSAEALPPASVVQSAPEQSPPAPTPLTQTPEPDPTDPVTSAVADSVSSPVVVTVATP